MTCIPIYYQNYHENLAPTHTKITKLQFIYPQ